MNLLLLFDSSQWKYLTQVTKTLSSAGSLDDDEQQEQGCTYNKYSSTQPHVDPTRKPCFRGKVVRSHIQIDVLGYMPSDEWRDLSW